MKRMVFIACTFFVLGLSAFAGKEGSGNEGLDRDAATYRMPLAYMNYAMKVYKEARLQAAGLEKDIFLKGYKGYLVLLSRGMVQNPDVLTIADFSQSNLNKRLYVIDLRNKILLIQTFVSHGKNSGTEIATSFSNANNSNKSVLGFLLTTDTYKGSNGLSLRFHGMEPGFNDLVTMRAIVVHGSRFVNEKALATKGEMVNSLGCPAVPMAQSKEIINHIKGGSVYFIYHPDETYALQSPILNASVGFTLAVPMTTPFATSDTLPPPLISPINLQ